MISESFEWSQNRIPYMATEFKLIILRWRLCMIMVYYILSFNINEKWEVIDVEPSFSCFRFVMKQSIFSLRMSKIEKTNQ